VTVNEISDLVIIDTEDALLVSSKKNSQNTKVLGRRRNKFKINYQCSILSYVFFVVLKKITSNPHLNTGVSHKYIKLCHTFNVYPLLRIGLNLFILSTFFVSIIHSFRQTVYFDAKYSKCVISSFINIS
jgi:hypothetical protein